MRKNVLVTGGASLLRDSPGTGAERYPTVHRKRPLLSIITVVLNGGGTLEQTLQSVFSQSFDDFEYLLIDGGSQDDTLDIIRKYQDRITLWISEPDRGIYDAMNKGVKLAQGRWIYFLGADDILLNSLEKVSGYLKDLNTLYYGDVYMPHRRRHYNGRFSAYNLASRNICQQSLFYTYRVWEKYAFDLKYPSLADYEINLRCFGDPDLRFEYIPVTVAVFSDAVGVSQTRPDIAFERDKLLLIRQNFSLPIFMAMAVRTRLLRLLKRIGIHDGILGLKHAVMRRLRG